MSNIALLPPTAIVKQVLYALIDSVDNLQPDEAADPERGQTWAEAAAHTTVRTLSRLFPVIEPQEWHDRVRIFALTCAAHIASDMPHQTYVDNMERLADDMALRIAQMVGLVWAQEGLGIGSYDPSVYSFLPHMRGLAIITDVAARKIAADWHSNRHPGYASLQSTGAILLDALRSEIEYDVGRCEAQLVNHPNDPQIKQSAESLRSLLDYAERYGERGPQPGWHDKTRY